MTRTPDDIKKGLECCTSRDCGGNKCPYFNEKSCNAAKSADAIALIKQLQDDNAQLNRCIENMTDKLNAMIDESVKWKAELDAALADFKLYRERNIKGECGVYACDLCKRGGRYEDWDEIKCPTGCTGVSHWEWRGVQKEG